MATVKKTATDTAAKRLAARDLQALAKEWETFFAADEYKVDREGLIYHIYTATEKIAKKNKVDRLAVEDTEALIVSVTAGLDPKKRKKTISNRKAIVRKVSDTFKAMPEALSKLKKQGFTPNRHGMERLATALRRWDTTEAVAAYIEDAERRAVKEEKEAKRKAREGSESVRLQNALKAFYKHAAKNDIAKLEKITAATKTLGFKLSILK